MLIKWKLEDRIATEYCLILRKIEFAGLKFCQQVAVRLTSWFGPRTWPKAERLPLLMAKTDGVPVIMSSPFGHFCSFHSLAAFFSLGQS